MQKKKNRKKVNRLKAAYNKHKYHAAFLIAAIVFPIVCGVSWYYWKPRPTQVVHWLLVEGKVLHEENSTEPLYNATVIVFTEEEGVKNFTDQNGEYQVQVHLPQNLSSTIVLYVYKENYVEEWRNQTMPFNISVLKKTGTYWVWGSVKFAPVTMKEEST